MRFLPAPMPIVVGVPRSGTTLLRMMLDAHPLLAVPPETGFLPALADLSPGPRCADDALRLMTGYHTWPDFHLDPEGLRGALRGLTRPADTARAFYRAYAARFAKVRWGDKTPTYGDALTTIAALLPEARFVHIIRDGRDVALSVRRVWFSPGGDIESCARDWWNRIARTRAQAAQVRHYLEVRYESLVRRPEQTLRTLCRYLDLEFDARMLRFHERAPERLAEHEARVAPDGRELVSKAARLRNQRLVTEPPRPDRVECWRREMSEDEQARFAAIAGDWLRDLGYADAASATGY